MNKLIIIALLFLTSCAGMAHKRYFPLEEKEKAFYFVEHLHSQDWYVSKPRIVKVWDKVEQRYVEMYRVSYWK